MLELRGQHWRVLPFDLGSSADHFALGDALARLTDEPTLWWHETEHATLILGTGQKWNDVDSAACRETNVLVIRRQAGGTAVLALPGLLGLDIALPPNHPLAPPDVVEAYRWLGSTWVAAARSLGIDAHLVSVGEARNATGEGVLTRALRLVCFGTLSPYEVTAGQRKLVGLAQVRRTGRALFQSGIHLRFDADGIARVLAVEDKDGLACRLRQVAAGINELVREPVGSAHIRLAFERALQERLGVILVPGTWLDRELEHAERVRGLLVLSE